MKKLLTSLAVVSVLGTTSVVNAQNINYQDEFDRMNQLINSMISSNMNRATIQNMGYPRINIQDKGTSYIYEFDLAGVDKKNIKLSIDDKNVLSIEGKKENKIIDKEKNYTRQEIFFGSFKRVIQLPQDANQEKLETKYDNGILTISIPKKESKKPKAKVIEIN